MMDVTGLHCGGQGIYIGLSCWYGWAKPDYCGFKREWKKGS